MSLRIRVNDFFIKSQVLLVVCLLISPLLSGQNQWVADSLARVYEKLDPDDTTCLRVLTLIAMNQNDPNKRLMYSEKLMDAAEKVQNPYYLHQAYLFHGQASRLRGDFEVAIYSLFKSLDFAILAGFRKGEAGVLIALADTYSALGNHASAVAYYQRGISKIGSADSSLRANLLLNLGDEYYLSKMYDSALHCFNLSMTIYEQMGNDRSGLAYNIGNIGLVYAEMGSIPIAEQNIRRAIKEFEALDDFYAIAIFLNYMADIYQRNGLLEKAQVYADSSMMISRKYGFKSEIRDNILRLSDIYASRSDYQAAYKFHKQYVDLKDSITNNEILTTIANLESSFELSRKKAEVDLLTSEKRNQQVIITAVISVLIIISILAIIIYAFYRDKNKINRILEAQKKELENLNQTKDKFFSIISHDLRGPISAFHGIGRSIKYAVNAQETQQLNALAEDIDQSVDKLSSLLDNLLNWALQQQGQFPVVPEKINLLEMCEEVRGTFSNMARVKGITVDVEIETDIFIWADMNTTRTIIRNLLSNALKFTPENGRVLIRANADGKHARIEIKDTGVGISEDKLKTIFHLKDKKSTFGTSGEKGLGLGLQLVHEFVQINNGTIEAFSRLKEGSSFTIQLPVYSLD